jgi:DNA-binding HxlR family transcriptional regulator
VGALPYTGYVATPLLGGSGVGTIEQRARHLANSLQTANERLGRKWAIESLHALYDAHPEPLRFGDLVRILGALDEDTVWESTLRRTLDHLRSHRLVARRPDPAGTPANSRHRDRSVSHMYIYTITRPGRKLVNLLRPIGEWVLENWPELDAEAGREEVDAT